MKVVIVEGLDNLGKSTLIHGIMQHYDTVKYIHCSKPEKTDPIYSAISQYDTYKRILDIINEEYKLNTSLVLLDRSWIGEYVYGCLYRGNGEEYVTDMIQHIRDRLSDVCTRHSYDIDVKYVYLYSSDMSLCVKNDDGLSLSDGDIGRVKKEADRFNSIFDILGNSINLLKICVNDRSSFRSREEILSEALDFIRR